MDATEELTERIGEAIGGIVDIGVLIRGIEDATMRIGEDTVDIGVLIAEPEAGPEEGIEEGATGVADTD